MLKRILIIFENDEICDQALSFASELAQRMDSEVTFLMLVEMAFKSNALLVSNRMAISETEKRSGKILGELTAEFIKKGILVSAAIRVGDPAQELVKFLAERQPYHAAIWGSGMTLPPQGPAHRHHWFKTVMNKLECPVYSVSSKDRHGFGG